MRSMRVRTGLTCCRRSVVLVAVSSLLVGMQSSQHLAVYGWGLCWGKACIRTRICQRTSSWFFPAPPETISFLPFSKELCEHHGLANTGCLAWGPVAESCLLLLSFPSSQAEKLWCAWCAVMHKLFCSPFTILLVISLLSFWEVRGPELCVMSKWQLHSRLVQ